MLTEPVAKMTARQVMSALRRLFQSEFNGASANWAFFEELRVGPGFAGYGSRTDPEHSRQDGSRIDAWVMGCWSSNWGARAIEVKVSRSDFLHEVKRPEKRAAALRLSNYYYFAAPRGLISRVELPPECGLIEVKDHIASFTVHPPRREADPPSWRFVASLARRVVRDQANAAYLTDLARDKLGLPMSDRIHQIANADRYLIEGQLTRKEPE